MTGSLLTPKQNTAFYAIMFLYISINMVLYMLDFMWLSALPAVIFTVWLAFKYPEKVIYFMAFATPLSIKVLVADTGFGIRLPAEPFMILLMLFFWLRIFLDGEYDTRIIRHPITIAILFNLFWLLVTSCTSTMPLVSFKFLLARFWFVTCFYFIAVVMFRRFENIKTFFWLFSAAMAAVVVYALQRHAAQLFDENYSTKAPQPFFPDHGVYAAVISLMIPIMLFFLVERKAFGLSLWQQFFALVISGIFLVGTVFSYTRAAWIGLIGAMAFLVIFLLRIRFGVLVFIGALLLMVGFYYQTEIYFKLSANKKVSSKSDIEQHVQSISNISTDASNTERINRWHSAIRMFKERPFLGWGPNTYMFKYSAFQLSSEMTIISVRTGTQGNAHSEYIGPLAEEGVLGLLSAVSLIVISLVMAMKIIYRSPEKRVRLMAMACILALITYFVHGLINDYLDQDKAAVPVFALMAAIAALDIYYQRNNKASGEVIAEGITN